MYRDFTTNTVQLCNGASLLSSIATRYAVLSRSGGERAAPEPQSLKPVVEPAADLSATPAAQLRLMAHEYRAMRIILEARTDLLRGTGCRRHSRSLRGSVRSCGVFRAGCRSIFYNLRDGTSDVATLLTAETLRVLVDQNSVSWNRVTRWLRTIEMLSRTTR